MCRFPPTRDAAHGLLSSALAQPSHPWRMCPLIRGTTQQPQPTALAFHGCIPCRARRCHIYELRQAGASHLKQTMHMFSTVLDTTASTYCQRSSNTAYMARSLNTKACPLLRLSPACARGSRCACCKMHVIRASRCRKESSQQPAEGETFGAIE